MSPVFLLVPAVLLAVGGAFAGSRWIEKCYDAEPDILSFPEKRSTQEKQRVKLLAPALALIFCYTLLTTPQSGFLRCALILCYQYFLVLYTFTDFEQQVIFDKMYLPFALLGLLSLYVFSFPAYDHFTAFFAGGIIFLLISILTRGGIGGGDIKLIALIGLWVGTAQLETIAIAGIVLGGLAAGFLLLTHRLKKKEHFAYGPYFTIVALLLSII
jgi:leader peptidase (prepilin peptidase)/N-methyltransferase